MFNITSKIGTITTDLIIFYNLPQLGSASHLQPFRASSQELQILISHFRKCGSVNSLRKHQAFFQKPQTPQTVDAQIRICDSPGSKCTFAQEFTDPRHDPAQLDVYTHTWIRDSLGKAQSRPLGIHRSTFQRTRTASMTFCRIFRKSSNNLHILISR